MKRILVPTDFSEVASNARAYALALAEITKSDVVIYHADSHDKTDIKQLQLEVLDSRLNKPFVNIEYLATHKQFSSVNLEEVVNNQKINLIVIGTSGNQAGLKKMLFDRNATDIAEHINCPVLIIPPDYIFKNINTIAYASDLNFIDKEIVPVVSFAQLFKASIEVFHVSPVYPDLGDVGDMNVIAKIAKVKNMNAPIKISYAAITTDGDNEFIEGLSEFMATHTADILVMYHQHLPAFDEFFTNSNTAKVIEHLHIPLLIYPKSFI